MNKILWIMLVCLLLLTSCIQFKPQANLSDLPGVFPAIQAGSPPADWGRGNIYAVPSYDPNSREMWQMDLRQSDLSNLDLTDSYDDLLYATFDTHTIWPSKQKMPQEYNWQRILELGKNPGLRIRQLHKTGITGKGVGIAIIDQPLLVEHQEYADQLRLYEVAEGTASEWTNMASMHGSGVASIAVGKTVGVAPEADLYFIGTGFCMDGNQQQEIDYACLARSVLRVVEINKLLPVDRKIRVLSMSIGWMPDSKGYDEITAATKIAKEAGMLVICSSVWEVHGFKFHALGRKPFSNPDRFKAYEPGLFWADYFFEEGASSDRLMVPMDSRTTAGPGSIDEYVFYRQGGASWAIPYIAGVYALSAQVKPSISPDEFWEVALRTGKTTLVFHEGKGYRLGPILDPVALIKKLN